MTGRYTCHLGGPSALRDGFLQGASCGVMHKELGTAEACAERRTRLTRQHVPGALPYEVVELADELRLGGEGSRWRMPRERCEHTTWRRVDGTTRCRACGLVSPQLC